MAKIILNDTQKYALVDALATHIKTTSPAITPEMVVANQAYYTSAILKMNINPAKINSLGIVKINAKNSFKLEDVFDNECSVHIARLTRKRLSQELVEVPDFE